MCNPAHDAFGASYQYDGTKYGIPYVEEGETQLTPEIGRNVKVVYGVRF